MSQQSSTPPPLPNQAQSAESGFATLRVALVILFLVVELAILAYALRGVIQKDEVRKIPGYAPWSEEVLAIAEQIPVQSGGRVKPFSSFARFEMLKYRGDLKMEIESGGKVHKIGPTEWLLDSLFRPELAEKLPVFRIDDSDILIPFGITGKERRTRLSLTDFDVKDTAGNTAFDKLIDRGGEILRDLEGKAADNYTDKDKADKKVADFAQLVLSYKGFIASLDILRGGLPEVDVTQLAGFDDELVQQLSKVSEPTNFFFWLPLTNRLAQSVQGLPRDPATGQLSGEWRKFVFEFNRQSEFSKYGVPWLPPVSSEDETWKTLGRKLDPFLSGTAPDFKPILEDYRLLEQVAVAASDPASNKFLEALTKFKDSTTERALSRGEGEVIPGEIKYYQRNYFMYALVWFIIAFLFSAAGWAFTEGTVAKVLGWCVTVTFLLGMGYLMAGIIHRIFLTGRPPVSNLYETIPFITWGGLLLLGLTELLTRRKIFISLASAVGVMGLFLAFRYELGDTKDNMDPLRAVLDSNYWLATHVVTISIGYSGGLIAFFLSVIFAFLSLSGVIKDQKGFARFMTRAVYGVTCFTLFFSLVGTVLGGIWANDSWGRFWGWDPKENGALLIVLWCLIILHARLAGWLRTWGIHLLSILGGSVVVFSWWGVNMLGVGLHSYGFTEGAKAVFYFYGATVVAFLVGIAAWQIEKKSKLASRQ